MSAVSGNVRPHKRKGFWYLIRRVSREFAAYADRPRIQISTRIRIVDDPRLSKPRRRNSNGGKALALEALAWPL